ncbi:hypothetical protein NDN08_007841 [Rhodosorus marinus]|uniref:DNA polymerase n=1 Tax=Rhodosorus marinus TaxID=101924 RepID=A0AAV8UZW3_9RHOD|nr:hypothetical protein NDN08_007841 [Rhodosorus marinus]
MAEATRRTSRRAGTRLPSELDETYASIRRLKAAGKSRLADYEVKEEAPLYDEVDEEQYKQIAEQKRKEAKEFLVAYDDSDGGTEQDYDAGLESEFEYEEQESFLPHVGGEKAVRKRRKVGERKVGKRQPRNGLQEPKQRLASAYFKVGDQDAADTSDIKLKEEQVVDESEFLLESLLDPQSSRPNEESATYANRKRVHPIPKFSELQRTGVSTAKLREALGPELAPQTKSTPVPDGVDSYLAPPPSLGYAPESHSQVCPQPQSVEGVRRSAAGVKDRSGPHQKVSVEGGGVGTSSRRYADRKTSEVAFQDDIADFTGSDPVVKQESVEVTNSPVLAPVKAETVPIKVEGPEKSAVKAGRSSGSYPEPKKRREVVDPSGEKPQNVYLDKDGAMLFYWVDLHEIRAQGVDRLYLTGRVPVGSLDDDQHASITLEVGGLYRELYFLPREELLGINGTPSGRKPDLWEDVHSEVEEVLFREAHVKEILAKEVQRSFPFDDDKELARPKSYLMVRYPMEKYSLSPSTVGKSFSRVFGTRTSATERLLLDRGFKGPCWLRIENPTPMENKTAWTRFAYMVDSPDRFCTVEEHREAPRLSALSLNLVTHVSAKTKEEEIVMASGLYTPELPVTAAPSVEYLRKSSSFTVICPGTRQAMPKVSFDFESVPSEAVLLNFLLAKLQRLEPDILVGHDLLGGIVEKLLTRMRVRGTPKWSRLGRLVQTRKLTEVFGTNKSMFARASSVSAAISGRLPCDTYIQAKELLPKAKDYSLAALAEGELKELVPSLKSKAISDMLLTVDGVTELVSASERRTEAALKLAVHLSIIPLTKQLTNLSGNVWSRTLRGMRAERIEYLLSHEFSKESVSGLVDVKFILPDKLRKSDKPTTATGTTTTTTSRRKAQYAGGLVLEPKRGLYDHHILQLDFNSLYPSIIQEYNICFTTVQQDPEEQAKIKLPEASEKEGILPRVLRRLVEQRRSVKLQMKSTKNPLLQKQLETRQLALKLTANSIYGCLGFENSRYFAQPMAEMVTAQGRDTLMKTVDLARDKQMDVIYGDTDSLFINTGLTELPMVIAQGADLKKEVNRRYRTLEIEVDGVYVKMLLLRKKKYAAMRIQNLRKPDHLVREVKGLDLVRHDWCDLSHEASEYSLQQILGSGLRPDDAVANILDFLTQLSEKVRSNRLSLKKYIITKSLTKMPEEYPDANSTPHVKVALRAKQFGKAFRTGDYVQYVICKNGDQDKSDTLANRAFHPDEVIASNGELIVDVEWYLSNQVLPPVDRLCDPIEGVHAVHLAEALKLDTRNYRHTNPADLSFSNNHADAEFGNAQGSNPEDRFYNCDDWIVTCPTCSTETPFHGIKLEEKRVVDWGITCPCGEEYPEISLRRQLQYQLRIWVGRYYLTPKEERMDDGSVQLLTYPGLHSDGTVERKLNARWLYLQFRYMLWLFDSRKGLDDQSETRERLQPATAVVNYKKEDATVRALYLGLSRQVENVFRRNAYRYIDLAELLASLNIKSSSREDVPTR